MHLSRAHLGPDRRPAAFRALTDVLCPEKGGLPVGGREGEARWSQPLPCAGVFLATTSCRVPLNGLQMVRKDFLAQREDQSPVLCGEGFITGW